MRPFADTKTCENGRSFLNRCLEDSFALAGAVKLFTGDARRVRAAKRLGHGIVLVHKRRDIFRWQCRLEGGWALGTAICGWNGPARKPNTDFTIFQ